MTVHSSVDESSFVSPDRVREKIAQLLRSAHLKGMTDAEIGDLAGIPARTVKSYRLEGREPSLSAGLALLAVLGKTSVNSMLALIGYSGQPLDDPNDVPPAQIVASVLPHISTIANAAADGRFDHRERPACRDAADQIIATLQPISSAGEV